LDHTYAVRFLWVNLQLLNICKQRSDEDIEIELRDTPRGLDRAYGRVWQQIYQQPIALRELARRCFVWVFYAARVLHIKELLEAVQIEDSAGKRENLRRYGEGTIIEACGNRIEVDNSLVRPIHYSVTEYFNSLKSFVQPEQTFREGVREFPVGSTVAHVELSRSCLSYLLQGFLNAGPCGSTGSLYNRVREYRLASYSSHFFDSHLRQLSDVPEDLRELLSIFLSSESTAFAAMMQLRALGGREINLFGVAKDFTEISWEMNASTVIHSTALMGHPCLQEDIKDLHLTETPQYILHQAASAGLLDYVAQLIQEGYRVDEDDSQKNTPLYYASKNGHREICSCLLENGADIAAKTDAGWTALHCATMGGHEAVVWLLLGVYNADAKAVDNSGRTVLHFAAFSGNEAVVRLLIEDYNVDVTAKTASEGTVLHFAAVGGNEAVVRLLIEDYNADIEAKMDDGETVLHCAALGGNKAIVRLLIEDYKADVEAKMNDGETVLNYAAAIGDEGMIRLLIEGYKADAEAKTDYGKTVLHHAARSGSEAAVRLLIEGFNADVEAKTDFGKTVLHYAVKGGSEAVVRLLIEDYEVDVGAKTDSGTTVLHHAVKGGNEAVVRLLIEDYEADVEAKTDSGKTALDLAKESGNKAVIQLLSSLASDSQPTTHNLPIPPQP
jgi:ankyrin repeat protein